MMEYGYIIKKEESFRLLPFYSTTTSARSKTKQKDD